MTPPGPVVLFGSGETSVKGGQILQALAPQLEMPLRVAVLETPAGFEPNSAQVAERVADFMRLRLQNYQPEIDVIPARHRRTDFSPDDETLAERLLDRTLIFLGPGSPTYAVRQLQNSAVWDMARARHRLGAALVLSSAAAIAVSAHTLPVYEIYKAGMDVHWQAGLNFFADFGLMLAIIPHWNNSEGGADLDTSHCFMGRARFECLRALVPDDLTVLGIDEHTALVMDVSEGTGQVMGAGGVTIEQAGRVWRVSAGETLALNALGPFRPLTAPEVGLPVAVWERARNHVPPNAAPSAEVLALVEIRQAARNRKDWPAADAARAQLSALGWDVRDTPSGPHLERHAYSG